MYCMHGTDGHGPFKRKRPAWPAGRPIKNESEYERSSRSIDPLSPSLFPSPGLNK